MNMKMVLVRLKDQIVFRFDFGKVKKIRKGSFLVIITDKQFYLMMLIEQTDI